MRALVLSAAGVFFGGLLVFQLFLGSGLEAFIAQNQVPLDTRLMAVRACVVLACVLAAVLGWRTLRRGPEALAGLEAVSWALLPLIPLCAVPGLFVRGPWAGNELVLLVAIGLVGIAVEATLERTFASVPPRLAAPACPAWLRDWGPLIVVGLATVTYAVRISALTVLQHQRMATSTSDLGEFDNLFFNALHGHPFRAPGIDGDLRDWGGLKVHAEFMLYLLLPFYAVRPGPQALLVIQSCVVALTALPIYGFASRRLGRPAAALCAVVFLLLPFVERPNFYDFHFPPVGMFFVACSIFFLERWPSTGATGRGTRTLTMLSLSLAAGSREDVAAGLVVLGLFVALSGHNLKVGLVLAGSALCYFVTIKFGVMTRLGELGFDANYQDLKVPGQDGFGAVINTLVSNPDYLLRRVLGEQKLLYLLHLTVPLLFLWLRRPWLLVAAAPAFVFTLAVTNRPPLSESSFQYTYLWAPYLMTASVLGLEQLGLERPSRRQAALAALALVALLANRHFGAFLGATSIRGGFGEKAFSISDEERARLAEVERLAALIPAEASVSATEETGPHVSTRLDFFSLKQTLGGNPDFLLIGPVGIPSEKDHVREAVERGYGVVDRAGPFMLLQSGAGDARDPALLRRIQR